MIGYSGIDEDYPTKVECKDKEHSAEKAIGVFFLPFDEEKEQTKGEPLDDTYKKDKIEGV